MECLHNDVRLRWRIVSISLAAWAWFVLVRTSAWQGAAVIAVFLPFLGLLAASAAAEAVLRPLALGCLFQQSASSL